MSTSGPHYMRYFYMRIREYAIEKWPFFWNLSSNLQRSLVFLNVNSLYLSIFWSPYLSNIMRSTCIFLFIVQLKNVCLRLTQFQTFQIVSRATCLIKILSHPLMLRFVKNSIKIEVLDLYNDYNSDFPWSSYK